MADINVGFYPQAEPNRLMETAQNAIALKSGALTAQQQQMDLVKNQVGYLVDGFSSLASKPDLSVQDFQDFGSRAVQEGILSPDVFNAELAAINKAGGDPQALRAMATNFGLRALDAGKRFDAQFGTPSMIDTGNRLVPVTVSPVTGIHPIGEDIAKTNSPQDLSTPTTIGMTPQGQPITGTTGQLLEKAGVNPLTAMPDLPAPNPLVPGGAPQQQAAPEGVVTTLPAGAVPALEEVGRGGGQALTADLARERTFQQDITPLEKAIPALEKLGTTGTGPGTEQINEIKSFLQSVGIPIADVEQIKNFDEARKYLTQFAQTNGDTGTNDKLAAAFAGNPSVGISNAAAIDVAKTALTLRRLQNAQVQAFDGSPDQYLQFAADFNAQQDPRAYGFDLMSAKQRNDLIGAMSADERARFVQSLRTAVQLGLVKPPAVEAPNG